eukprot:CAMPEP_0184687220 /NCGR_PEP_ID=MMETSP0312-20130426/25636_1 /TAXON_ID=31354 /ORGANISM="Compsopogon coeruleus, Strain SAG 36.94" /LENGTH=460 /DNA_ID=CAMNT_0027143137 /DNA_START=64 /DNA_END=1446 /DNA_ORIENTATION=-
MKDGLVGRDWQIRQVTGWFQRRLLGCEDVGVLVLSGWTSTGKSTVLNAVAEAEGVRVVVLDVVLAGSERGLTEWVWSALDGNEDASGREGPRRCRFDHIMDVADAWMMGKTSLENGEVHPQSRSVSGNGLVPMFPPPIALVLERAERLQMPMYRDDILESVMTMFGKLPGDRVLPVVVTSRWIAPLWSGSVLPRCTVVEFPGYSRDETHKILLKMHPASSDIERELLEGFLKLLLDVVYHACTDVRELSRFCSVLFPTYLDAGRKSSWSPSELYQSVLPFLQSALDNLYRERIDVARGDPSTALCDGNSDGLQFPLCVKYLLIGAFLASTNPPQHDRRYFTKDRTRQSRSRRRTISHKSSSLPSATSQPYKRQSFSLQRLLAITESLTLDQRDPNPLPLTLFGTSLLTHIADLTHLHLLTINPHLTEPTLTCNAPESLIHHLATHLQLDLAYFLHHDPQV